ncbi:Uncharacterised protein [Staphylococcus chromogenes]|nr:hypothetical protein GCM10008139_05070 [Staphylococcus chromogenes]SUM13559.1 Uncharacterised protein [Staphylococcus chromogenes]
MYIFLFLLFTIIGTLSILLFITLALNQQGGFKFFWDVEHIENLQRYVIYLFIIGILSLVFAIYLLLKILSDISS